MRPQTSQMSDQTTLKAIPFLPCVEPSDADTPAVLSAEDTAIAANGFAYLGIGMGLDAFRTYARAYDYGPIPPDQLVIHNTANPDATWAPLNADPRIKWDRDEAHLIGPQVYEKRRRQLAAVRDYYISLGWSAGPHLFVDDRCIWLFTPMNTIGVHAKEGNSYHDAQGKLHYTLGIEVVGWYGKVGWPSAIQVLLRGAVQTLRDVLGTFQIVYKAAPAHQPAAHQGSIAFHRDYNKPECPGGIITPAYALPILATPPPPTDPLRARKLVGPPPAHAPVWCSVEAANFYVLRGGLTHCGYPLRDEFRDPSLACTVLVCERVVIKTSEAFGVEQALIQEAVREGWL